MMPTFLTRSPEVQYTRIVPENRGRMTLLLSSSGGIVKLGEWPNKTKCILWTLSALRHGQFIKFGLEAVKSRVCRGN